MFYISYLGLFCKLDFTKLKKKAFFLIVIRFYSQKSITFASRFEKRCKISNKILNMQAL